MVGFIHYSRAVLFELLPFLGLFLICGGLALALRWVHKSRASNEAQQERMASKLVVCLSAVGIGLALILSDRIIEFSMGSFWSLKMEARSTVDDLKQLSDDSRTEYEFFSTFVSAQADDRAAFERLLGWANDEKYPLKQKAQSAWAILSEKHSSQLFLSNVRVSWKEGIDPQKL